MLKCKDIPVEAEKLQAGELSFGRRAAVRMHLFICSNCRRYVRQLNIMIGALQQFPQAPISEEKSKDIIDRLSN